jgi:hypothetical protein
LVKKNSCHQPIVTNDDASGIQKKFMLNDNQQFFEPRVWHEVGIILPLVLQLHQMDFQIDLICICLHADSIINHSISLLMISE